MRTNKQDIKLSDHSCNYKFNEKSVHLNLIDAYIPSMNILIITRHFPSSHSGRYAWLKPLSEAFVSLGHNCAVIAPVDIKKDLHIYKFRREFQCPDGKRFTVLRPLFLFTRFRKRAIERAIRHCGFVPDCIYGQFWSAAYHCYGYASAHNIPLFVNCGESDVQRLTARYTHNEDWNKFCKYVTGIICVSEKNREECIDGGFADAAKCLVAANGVNRDVFKPMNRRECRERLGLPQDVFIVSFVGHFNNRKGVVRLSKAISRIRDANISSIFIGKGDETPDCPGILFCGEAAHDTVATYLNASDIFVLPTLNEGCSNAIVEAICCGLPVISSARSFNQGILDDSNAILIDPENIDEIALAIKTLKENTGSRQRMAQAAIQKSESLSVIRRAEKILAFIEENLLSA